MCEFCEDHARSLNKGTTIAKEFTQGMKFPRAGYIRAGSRVERVILGLRGRALVTVIPKLKKDKGFDKPVILNIPRQTWDHLSHEHFGIIH